MTTITQKYSGYQHVIVDAGSTVVIRRDFSEAKDGELVITPSDKTKVRILVKEEGSYSHWNEEGMIAIYKNVVLRAGADVKVRLGDGNYLATKESDGVLCNREVAVAATEESRYVEFQPGDEPKALVKAEERYIPFEFDQDEAPAVVKSVALHDIPGATQIAERLAHTVQLPVQEDIDAIKARNRAEAATTAAPVAAPRRAPSKHVTVPKRALRGIKATPANKTLLNKLKGISAKAPGATVQLLRSDARQFPELKIR